MVISEAHSIENLEESSGLGAGFLDDFVATFHLLHNKEDAMQDLFFLIYRILNRLEDGGFFYLIMERVPN